MLGGKGADVDAQLGAFAVADDDLFAPVAEDVGLQAGVALGAVVEYGTVEKKKGI